MDEITDIAGDRLIEAFFGILNAEVFAWDAVQKALQNAGQQVGTGRLIPLMFLAAEPMRLQELADRTRAKQSAASRLVERMVIDGLIVKERDGGDGRAVMLHITEEGRRVEKAGRKVLVDCLNDLFADFDESELSRMRSLPEHLAASNAGANS